jgi:hypothetical protein
MEVDDDGYTSDLSIGTQVNMRPRRAFLVRKGEDGCATQLAFGECRLDDEVFIVEAVAPECEDVDIVGQTLGSMRGKLLALDDLEEDEELGLDWDETEEQEGAQLELEGVQLEHEDERPHIQWPGEEEDNASRMTEAEAKLAAEVEHWREQACGLQDEVQLLRDSLADAEARDEMARLGDAGKSVRVRVEVRDPTAKSKTQLISLDAFVRDSCRKRERPILTPTERVRDAKMAVGVYKDRAATSDGASKLFCMELRDARAELNRKDQELASLRAQLQQQEEQIAAAIKHASDVAEWKRIELRQQHKQAQSELERQHEQQQSELATRAKRASTWHTKRANLARTCARAKAESERVPTQMLRTHVPTRQTSLRATPSSVRVFAPHHSGSTQAHAQPSPSAPGCAMFRCVSARSTAVRGTCVTSLPSTRSTLPMTVATSSWSQAAVALCIDGRRLWTCSVH